MNCQQAHSISITVLLASYGLRPVRQDAHGSYYHSPFSASGDKKPSLQVSPDGRAFHDWSSGLNGDIITLTRALNNNCSTSEALAHLSRKAPDATYRVDRPQAPTPSRAPRSRIIVDDIMSIRSNTLMGYAWKRGINRNILTDYCREVHYHLEDRPNSPYYAIGWPNDSGGFELRNQIVKQAIAPKDITTVGDLTGCTCMVVEGFFDFLSAVALKMYDPYTMNAIVLNSTALLPRAIKAIRALDATSVACLLDGDEAGRRAKAAMFEAFPDKTKDFSSFYTQKNCKDLNEYLILKRGPAARANSIR